MVVPAVFNPHPQGIKLHLVAFSDYGCFSCVGGERIVDTENCTSKLQVYFVGVGVGVCVYVCMCVCVCVCMCMCVGVGVGMCVCVYV